MAPKDGKKVAIQSVSASQLFKAHEQHMKQRRQQQRERQNVADTPNAPQKGRGVTPGDTPQLGRGVTPGEDVMLCLDSPPPAVAQPSRAKVNAAAMDFATSQSNGVFSE